MSKAGLFADEIISVFGIGVTYYVSSLQEHGFAMAVSDIVDNIVAYCWRPFEKSGILMIFPPHLKQCLSCQILEGGIMKN